MPISRRSFLAEAGAAGFLPAFLANAEAVRHLGHTAMAASAEPTAGETYWSNLYRSGAQRGRAAHFGNESRDPLIAYFHEQNGLQWVEDTKRESLPSFEDDAVVTLELGGFRAGKLDEPKLGSVRYAQMHLSCQQVRGSDFIGPLAWASLATVFAGNASKLPSVQSLSFNPVQPSQTMPGAPQLNRVLLPEGGGHLSVNITTTPTTSLLDKILSTTIGVAKILTPILGFPAFSLPALSAFYTFYGSLEKAHPGDFLINTSLKDVAVTQQGAHDPDVSSKAINLLSGYYILVPTSQRELLESEMKGLAIQDGYLIQRKDVDSTLAVEERVKDTVPELTYVTLHVGVTPASTFRNSSSDDSKSGSSKKKTSSSPNPK